MNRPVTIVLLLTFLALVAATVWVPFHFVETMWRTDYVNDEPADVSTLTQFDPQGWWPVWRWGWLWTQWGEPDLEIGVTYPNAVMDSGVPQRVTWILVFTEQALIVLIGGGLLTFVVRRDRRRRADRVSSA